MNHLDQQGMEQLSAIEQSRFKQFVRNVQERLTLPTISSPILVFLLTVFMSLGISSCSKDDEDIGDAKVLSIDPDATSCKNENGILQLDFTVHKDDKTILDDVRFDIEGPGENGDWVLTFKDGYNTTYTFQDNDPAIKFFYAPGDVRVSASIPGGGPETDIVMFQKDGHQTQVELAEDVGCPSVDAPFIHTDFELIECDFENGIRVFTGIVKGTGNEADGVLNDTRMDIQGSHTGFTIKSGSLVWDDTNDTRDVSVNMTSDSTRTMPLEGTVTGVSYNSTAGHDVHIVYKDGAIQRSADIKNADECIDDCEPYELQGSSFERDGGNHCKFTAIFKMDDCDYTDKVYFTLSLSKGLASNNVKYKFYYEDGTASNTINMGDGNGSFNVGKNIHHVRISGTAASALKTGDQITLTAKDASSNTTDTETITHQ